MCENIVFAMVVGPGESSIAIDSLEWALQLYPKSTAWVRDDATTDGTFERLKHFAQAYPRRVALERNSSVQGYRGIAVSTFRIYSGLCRSESQIEMVITLDPDACIIRQGLVTLAREKFAEHGPGMLGSYKISPDGKRRKWGNFQRDILLDLLPFGIDKQTRKVGFGLPFYLRFLLPARRHGYRLGEHVLSALHVIHGDTLRELDKVGFWASIGEGSRYLKGDDPIISLGVKAVGHALIDINDPERGDVQAWLQYKGPLPHSAEEIWKHGFVAVHPLKRDAASQAFRLRLRALAEQERLHLA